jgi:hypothetical protein
VSNAVRYAVTSIIPLSHSFEEKYPYMENAHNNLVCERIPVANIVLLISVLIVEVNNHKTIDVFIENKII